MSVTLIDKGNACRLVFDGYLTFEFSRDLEDRIIDALRRFKQFELDLSNVQEIDLCGLHLLQTIHSFCGDKVELVAGASIVEQASRRLLTSRNTMSLRGN